MKQGKLKYILISILLISLILFQSSSLIVTSITISWYNTDNELLDRGTVTVEWNGNSVTDTINNGKTYHVFEEITGINEVNTNGPNMFPNPVVDQLNIVNDNYLNAETVRFVDLQGRVLGETVAGENVNINLPVGISIMQYGNSAKKIISESGGEVEINFLEDNIAQSYSHLKSAETENITSVSFLDDSGEYEGMTTTFSQEQGTTHQEDLIVQYTAKDFSQKITAGIDVDIRLLVDGEEVYSGNTSSDGFVEADFLKRVKSGSDQDVVIQYSGENVVNEELHVWATQGGANAFVQQAEKEFGVSNSNNLSVDADYVNMVDGSEVGTDFTERADSVLMKSFAQNLPANYVSDTISGWVKAGLVHRVNTVRDTTPAENDYAINGTINTPVTAEAWENGVKIDEGNFSGSYALNWTSQLENIELDSLVVVSSNGTHKDSVFTNIAMEGNNPTTKNINLEEKIVDKNYTLNGTVNASSQAEAWDNGEKLAEGTLTPGTYAMNWTSQLENIELDSLRVISLDPEFENKTYENIAMTGDVAKTQNIELDEVPTGTTFTEKMVFADDKLDNYLDGVVFSVKTLSDNVEHDYVVDSTAHVQNIVLEGDYTSSTPVEISFKNAAAQGLEGNNLRVLRNYQQPVASNGVRGESTTTTIGDLFNEVSDTTWIGGMSNNFATNDTIAEHMNGGKEWVYSENGKRTMNVNIIDQFTDLSTGTYLGPISPEELATAEANVELVVSQLGERGTGYKIMDVNVNTTSTYNTSAGTVNIFYDNTTTQPANSHNSKNTTQPDAYDFARGYTRDGSGMFIGQLSPETYQAINYVEDFDNGSVTTSADLMYFNPTTQQPEMTEMGEEVLIHNMTHTGGTAPTE